MSSAPFDRFRTMSYQNRTMPVHPAAPPAVESRWAPELELLIGLFATGTPGEPRRPSWAPPSVQDCPPATRRALRAVGVRAGEVWLHMLGLALDRPGGDLADRIETADAVEVRRYLVGEHVPAWRAIAGADVLAAAA